MSIIFQNNTISFSSGTLFSDVTFAGWKVTTNGRDEGVTTAIRMMNVRHRDGSKSVYAVPIEVHAVLPEHADITISGPYIEQDGDSKFEYLVLRNPREPNKILAIMTKEISMKAIRVAMQTSALCDKCGNTCGARS